jgi:mono/diheme cytochrome c family protein
MVFRILLGVVVAGELIQLIPTGYRHTDPAVIQEPAWDNPRTRELAKRACFNCHSQLSQPTVTAMKPSGPGIPELRPFRGLRSATSKAAEAI